MFKSKTLIFILLALAFTAGLAYCQEKAETRKIITISGIATKVDAEGGIIEVEANGRQIALSVPEDASITNGTKNIGLMDIEESYPVTIQYYSPSPGKFVVVSITYNNN